MFLESPSEYGLPIPATNQKSLQASRKYTSGLVLCHSSSRLTRDNLPPGRDLNSVPVEYKGTRLSVDLVQINL
jgi:hypothetical protein